MPVDVNDFWDNLKLRLKNKSHGVYKMRELHLIPDAPGLYSWHINLNSHNFDDYYKVFHQKRVSINIKGSLKEQYKGNIRRTYDESHYSDSPIDMELCEFASLVFCPPLYIGISLNLKRRLSDHFDELEKVQTGKISLTAPKSLGRTDFDTIVESSHFAQRMGFSLKEFNKINLDTLFIKTIELDKGYNRADLLKVEKYLNRTFVPMYGRR